MDYMKLGVKSRKTGFNVKRSIRKDRYSMDSIDDFFNDDDTTVEFSRRKSAARRSSILPVNRSQNFLPSSLTQQARDSIVPDEYAPLEDVAFEPLPEEEGDLEEEPDGRQQAFEAKLQDSQKKYAAQEEDEDDYMFEMDRSIRLTPDKKAKDIYRDIPDLIEDDETTKDNISVNTSDNEILEDDDLDDDYQPQIEEDHEYIDDDDEDEDDEDEGEQEDVGEQNTLSSDNEDDSMHSQEEAGDSVKDPDDEEFIKKQAAQVINDDYTINSEGIRRSKRVKVAPLEYWRNEKIVYKRSSSKPVLDIDAIVTHDPNDDMDEEEELALTRNGTKKRVTKKGKITSARPYNYVPTGRPRGRPRKPKPIIGDNPNNDILNDIQMGSIPHAEWLSQGILQANVNITDTIKNNEIVAFAPDQSQSEQVKKTKDENYSLQIMFDKYREHFGSGMLKIPIAGKKATSHSYNACINFFVVQGIVEITLGESKFFSTEGSTFQIPAFNNYSISNKGNNEVKLFFVQVTMSEEALEANGAIKEEAHGELEMNDDMDNVSADEDVLLGGTDNQKSDMTISELR